MASSKKAPWDKLAPKKSRHTHLAPKSKARAKATARKAGRPYPSLVDNMNAAKKQRAARAKTSSRKLIKMDSINETQPENTARI